MNRCAGKTCVAVVDYFPLRRVRPLIDVTVECGRPAVVVVAGGWKCTDHAPKQRKAP